MIRVIILVVLGYLAYRIAKRWVRSKVLSDRVEDRKAGRIDDIMVKDPQCGTYFARRDGVALKHEERDLLFCSRECRDKFLAANSPPGA
jgi:uncharacterized protein